MCIFSLSIFLRFFKFSFQLRHMSFDLPYKKNCVYVHACALDPFMTLNFSIEFHRLQFGLQIGGGDKYRFYGINWIRRRFWLPFPVTDIAAQYTSNRDTSDTNKKIPTIINTDHHNELPLHNCRKIFEYEQLLPHAPIHIDFACHYTFSSKHLIYS